MTPRQMRTVNLFFSVVISNVLEIGHLCVQKPIYFQGGPPPTARNPISCLEPQETLTTPLLIKVKVLEESGTSPKLNHLPFSTFPENVLEIRRVSSSCFANQQSVSHHVLGGGNNHHFSNFVSLLFHDNLF